MTRILHGLINAITTPFSADDRIDEGAFRAHLQWLEAQGVSRQLVAGTTGEFFSLTMDERRQLLVAARQSFRGHLCFQAGALTLRDTIALVRFAGDNGADSVVVLPPFYLASPPENGLTAWLQAVSAAATVPFLIYNFPRHTQASITADILARVPHAGLKDSAADLRLIAHTPAYFIGSDTKLLASRDNGGAGFVSARSNAAPGLYAALDAALRENDQDRAQVLHGDVLALCQKMSGPAQIRLVKESVASQVAGYPTAVRLPLV